MRRHIQHIESCSHCGRYFDDNEDYWKSSRNECYCMDNKCGWEDEDELTKSEKEVRNDNT